MPFQETHTVFVFRIVTALAVLGASALRVDAMPRDGGPGAPEAVVRSLYAAHKKGYGHLFDKDGMGKLGRFFDAKMTSLIRKNIVEAPKDEVGNLDFDPLYNAQDIVISDFKIGKATVTGQKATVLVTFKNDTRRDRITYLLHKTPQGWRISNLDYGKRENLAKILSAPQ